MNADIGILGGGISGLSLAAFLTPKCEILEAGSRPGGLARAFGRSGFLADIGGHIMFSKDKDVLNLMVDACIRRTLDLAKQLNAG